MHFKLVIQAGLFVGGALAALLLTWTGVLERPNIDIDSGGGDVNVVSTPAELVECPDGWRNTSAADEEHVISLSCSQADWIVYLQPDGSFGWAFHELMGAVFDPDKVPGW